MFRENVLVNEQIIERVSESMIPVALDYQKVLNRQSPEARFLLPLMKQRNQDQGLWIFSPAGEALGGFSGFGDMVGETKRVLENALRAYGPVAPRQAAIVETHPTRGRGFQANGDVCLAEYVRQRDPTRIKSPVISSVNLSGNELAAFAPRKLGVGEQWALPESVAKKLCRVVSPMCYQHAPQPDWVKDVLITANVRAIADGVARIRYEGKMSSERIWMNGKILSQQELTFAGEGVYDTGAATMRSLLIVGSGTFRWPEESPDKLVLFDALIEWEAEIPETANGD